MSGWHREHPDYEETGMQPPDPRDVWDMERKRQKEEGQAKCVGCGKFLGPNNTQDSLHCVDCWSDEDDFIF